MTVGGVPITSTQRNPDIYGTYIVYEDDRLCEWYFAHIEKYMNHVFDDDVLKLQSLVRGIVGEKKTARAESLK